MSEVHKGACFCGTVTIETAGEPAMMGYCHCESCRHWSAGPVNAFTLWQPDTVSVTSGAEHLTSYTKQPSSERHFCSECGGHVFTKHPGLSLTDVFAAILPSVTFEPAIHVNYAETVLRIKDGLPKLKDFPAEVGGSGETVPE